MNKALDKEGNVIYADSGIEYKECYCLECGELVKHKRGDIRAHYFSHKSSSNCAYGNDKDYKSPWHIRMQNYFPKEMQEYRFKDSNTGEVHIADVFLKDSNTVIEFQKSHIDPEEFSRRTQFHTSEGRRILWIYDESKPDSEYGRFKKVEGNVFLYEDHSYKWLRMPRKELEDDWYKPIEKADKFRVYVFWGGEEDVVHRILSLDELGEVTISVHDILMTANMDTDEFFMSEEHWTSQSPWKERIDARDRLLKERKEERERRDRTAINSFLDRTARYRRW